ncbi:MAG: hypothetical protein SFZ03_08075 [Candidatus Melainabacteria bacterium]|nr:hypothetical protein [Candidatus Melainabacteria bacterium]
MAESSGVAFLLHDAGETEALRPVIARLAQAHVPYTLLTTGTASRLLAGHPHQVSLPDAPVAGTPTQQAAWWQQMTTLCQRLHPAVVMTGVVSPFQQLLSGLFRRQGAPVVGYTDGYTLNPTTELFQRFAKTLSAWWVPTAVQAAWLRQCLPQMPVAVVGQPTADRWERQNLSASPATTDAATQTPLTAPSTPQTLQPPPRLLWVGGYGAGYEEAFGLFCSLARQWAGRAQFQVALHPSQDGAVERQWIDRMGLTGLVEILPKHQPTERALAQASAVLTQDSSMVVQGLMLGKPVLLTGPPVNPTQWNAPVAQGLLSRYTKVETLAAELLQQLRQPPADPSEASRQVRNQLGLPNHSALRMAEQLQQHCAESTKPVYAR